ncbi:DUF4390 domain-containing protein [Sulfuriflexus mobilis]|uniref:DUF4390 domain-containing protein n=1 Tax=Sulfuriflexus mobilis TaxID=1811807 RepID=UPI000F8300A8|nr:DUF4390 domain-containing protein [Sulfuriflexus mobilis]
MTIDRKQPGLTLLLVSLCLGILGLSAVAVQAAEFTVRDARTHQVDGVYQLEADIRYQFSDPVHEALANGVPITIRLQVEIEQRRNYLWNKSITSLQQVYTLEYHALSEQYLVRNVSRGQQQNFRSLNTALLTMGEIRALPILDERLLTGKPSTYQVRLRSEIDLNALPAPLRPVAWLSSDWKIRSEWFVCPLRS